VYQSHSKQLKPRGRAAPLAATVVAGGGGAAYQEEEREKKKFSFETFGVEPIGPYSWKLNSPRSLQVDSAPRDTPLDTVTVKMMI